MTEKRYILIIDDDKDMVEATKIVLESKGYEVGSAFNSDEGAEALKHHKPDLIMLDVMMRTSDEGFQFSYHLKQDSELSNIPVLMVTSVGDETGFKFDPNKDGDYLPVGQML